MVPKLTTKDLLSGSDSKYSKKLSKTMITEDDVRFHSDEDRGKKERRYSDGEGLLFRKKNNSKTSIFYPFSEVCLTGK